ncbi:MAG: cytochrome c peroxidase, partial [Pseudomonadota bacterium]|nr:cytochrome c peroxidase [Pseudomonadota bacterium]
AQALAPLEDPAEHGANRMRLARLVTQDATYRDLYEQVFGTLPDFSDAARFPEDAAPAAEPHLRAAWRHMGDADRELVNQVFANIGKALAAYQRKLMPGPARFDAYVATLAQSESTHETSQSNVFTRDETAGLRLFIGEARCVECHNGPLFTNNEFHNTGLLPPRGSVPDQGRSRALTMLRDDAFNCLGAYSDAGVYRDAGAYSDAGVYRDAGAYSDARAYSDAGAYSDTEVAQCGELTFMRTGPELIGAMRTPSLRNLGGTAPYMHKGQIPDLASVLAHYNAAPQALIGHSEAEPLGLSRRELQQLEAFLLTLDAPLASDPVWLAAPVD